MTRLVVPTTGCVPLFELIVWVTRDSKEGVRESEIGRSTWGLRLLVFGRRGELNELAPSF